MQGTGANSILFATVPFTLAEKHVKGCKLEGSRREKHCTEPDVCGAKGTKQITSNKSEKKLRGPKEELCTNTMFVRQNIQSKNLLNKANKHATNFTGADGIALHKTGVCEAKQAKQSSD